MLPGSVEDTAFQFHALSGLVKLHAGIGRKISGDEPKQCRNSRIPIPCYLRWPCFHPHRSCPLPIILLQQIRPLCNFGVAVRKVPICDRPARSQSRLLCGQMPSHRNSLLASPMFETGWSAFQKLLFLPPASVSSHCWGKLVAAVQNLRPSYTSN